MSTKSIAIKSAIGLVGVSGAGFAAHRAFQSTEQKTQKVQEEQKKTSLKDKLEESKYNLLSSESGDWVTILESYKKIVKNNATFKFDNFDGNKPSDSSKEAVDILKEHCTTALSNTEENNNAIFQKAKKWCVEPVTVATLLGKQGFEALNAEDSDPTGEKSKWETKIRNYKKATRENQNLEGLTLDGGNEEVTEKNYTDIKAKCKEISTIKNHEEKYEASLKGFELWCSNK